MSNKITGQQLSEEVSAWSLEKCSKIIIQHLDEVSGPCESVIRLLVNIWVKKWVVFAGL